MVAIRESGGSELGARALSQRCPRQIGRKPFAVLCDGDAMRFWSGCCEERLVKEG